MRFDHKKLDGVAKLRATLNSTLFKHLKYFIKSELVEEDWLGDPANLKGLDFDVERTGHVTLTVHKHDRISKIAEVVDNLFVFGVDFRYFRRR